MNMKTLNASEFNNTLIEMFSRFDPENDTYYSNVFGSYDMHIAFNNGRIRAIETSDGDSYIYIYGFDNRFVSSKPGKNANSYSKLSAKLRKELYEIVTSTNYERCKDENGFTWIQEVGAEKTAFNAYYDELDKMNIVERVKLN